MTSPYKIAILRLGSLGDVIHVLPALRVLRSHLPSSHITWIVEEGASQLLLGNPDLDRVIVLPRKKWQKEIKKTSQIWPATEEIFSKIKELRDTNYNTVIDFHGNFRSGLLLAILKSPRKIGFDRAIAKEGSFFFYREKISISPSLHKTERYVALTEKAFSFKVGTIPLPSFPFHQESVDKVSRWLSTLPQKRPLIVVHPGVSRHLWIKRYSPESFTRLIDLLDQSLKGTIVLTWGMGEEDLVKKIAEKVRANIFPTPDIFSIPEMIALFEKMDLFIGCDTGPLHLAVSLGKKVIGLYGPKPPQIYRPYFGGEVVIDSKLPCVSCNSRKCKFSEEIAPCMNNIAPEVVSQRACKILQKDFPL